MLNAPESACLLIADITGYTGYLAGVELDHAQDIPADMMDTVVGQIRPTFKLAKLEGDAAFAYAPAGKVDGSMVQDTIEATYFAFRRRLRDIGHASQCECNACILIPRLDLKAVVHHGSIVRQRVAGHEELVGRDVILVHRLLKHGIVEALGTHAYAAYTGASVEALGIDPQAQGLAGHCETIDIIGEVQVWVSDLEGAWDREQDRARTVVGREDAVATYTFETPAQRQIVWEYLTSPSRRPEWSIGTDAVQEQSAAGRRGTGTTNHCIHGKDAIVEEILDWETYDHWTTRSTMPMPGLPKMTMSQLLTDLPDGGTQIEIRIGRPRPRDREAFQGLQAIVEPMFAKSMERLLGVLAGEAERAATEAADEPALPRSAGRFIDEPVRAVAVDPAAARSSSP